MPPWYNKFMFSVSYRDHVQDEVLRLAAADPRVVAGAVVGSLALGGGDRWSDLDLTFAVAEGIALSDVLKDWTRDITEEFGAICLFEVPWGSAIYLVFLLPDCLQLDLSFAPASTFSPAGPNFKLLFGHTTLKPFPSAPSPSELFGYAVHYALRARISIERGRYWSAEYWISGARDYALSLACRRRDLPSRYGKGFDDLPQEVRDSFASAFVASLDREELLRALGCVIDSFIYEANCIGQFVEKVEPELRKLMVTSSLE